MHEALSIATASSINRATLRQQRRSLSARQQRRAATALGQRLSQLTLFQHARRIAYYIANDGEISPQPAIDAVWKRGRLTYLPVLHPLKIKRLYFARHQALSTLRHNRFGIPEPQLGSTSLAPLWTLDIILLPLVAFDRSGNRLGMGGGFYDRSLAALNHSAMKRPLFIGLAHHCQEVTQLESQNWDIPLNMIVTDREIIPITPNNSAQLHQEGP
ncbi:5-formyltetrahydrofolate cyclo-ligase [Gammaproteobacteria bacterium 53_120_T64]|nr:5-formyltetrahydrofolate cyclo-ligase [Gammaproteobacteria bacterium 53_120_T64]